MKKLYFVSIIAVILILVSGRSFGQASPSCTPTSSSWESGYEIYDYNYGIDQIAITGYSGSTLSDAGLVSTPLISTTTGYVSRVGTVSAVSFQQGGVYGCTATWGISASHDFMQMWIDFNDDGTFQASEEVTPVSGYPTSQPTICNITIPVTAATGTHLMRLRGIWEVNSTDIGAAPAHVDPCLFDYASAYPEYWSGDVVDYSATIVALPACSGTPTAGSATSSISLACPSLSFSLGLTGSAASGLAYQWQSSTDSVSWTDISGATSMPYTASESAATYYRCYVTCISDSSTDTSSFVYVPYISGCYCTPSYEYSPASSYDALDTFELTGYSGSSIADAGPASVPGSGYEDRTSISVNLQQNGTYSGYVGFNSYSSELEDQIWIDFNDNGTFEASEAVSYDFGVLGCSMSGSSAVFSITIPVDAPVGNHRMRVRQAETYNCTPESLMDPCAMYNSLTGTYYYYGMTRDYTATIIALPTCTGTVTGGTSSISPSTGDTYTTFGLTLSGSTAASGLTYQWQSSPNDTTWTDIPGGTTYSYSFTGISANTYYHCIISCPASSSTATSSSVEATFAIVPTCIPTSSSWISEGSYYIYYGADAFGISGYSGTSLSDASLCSTANPLTGYLDHTSMTPIQLQQNGVYSSSVTWGYDEYHQFAQVWIDFNDDGTFQVSEEVSPVSGYSASYYSPSPAVFNISIPLTADTGSHLMRLRAAYSWYYDAGTAATDMDPCLVEFGTSYPEYYSGDVIDYRVQIVALPACSGAVTTGTVVATPSVGDSVTSFTLSLSGATAATGLTYIWQTSFDDATWTTISGATGYTYSFTGIGTNTWFRCIIGCPTSSTTDTSAGTMITYEILPTCYPLHSSWAAESAYEIYYGADVFKVTGYSGSDLFDSSMTSAAASASPLTGYLDRLSMPALQMQQGGVYGSTVSWYYSSSHQYLQVWIDFNNDGTFQTSEEVTPVSGYPYSEPTLFNISIPVTADTGMHLMRLRAIWEQNSTDIGHAPAHCDPCLLDYGGAHPHYYSGDVIDYNAYIVALPPCSGTVTGGSAVAAPTLGDASTSFTLSLSGTTAAASLTYQWQSSPDSATWTDITGATGVGYTFTGITTNTYYRCVITCPSSSSTGYSAGVLVTYELLPTCYPTSTSWGYDASSYYIGYGADVFSVTGYGGTTLYDSSITSHAAISTGYLDRLTMTPVELQQNGVYPSYISWGASVYAYNMAQVWIDFNNDGTFQTSEEVTPVSGYSSSSTVSPTNFNITIPLTADTGIHLMRMRAVYEETWTDIGSAPTDLDPCLISFGGTDPYYESGDVVDYNVRIVTLPPCSGTVTGGSAVVSPTAGDASTTFTLSLSGSTSASGLTYQWQSSTDGSTWTSITGATNNTYTFTGISVSTYFQCIITCPTSSSTATTTPVTATYMVLPTCLPTSSSWGFEYSFMMSYGVDVFSITGYGGTSLYDASLTSLASSSTGYLDHMSEPPVQLQQSGTYSSYVSWGTAYAYQMAQVWIDFNDDGTFQTSEEVSPVSGYSSFSTSSPTGFNITIPAGADTGLHLMRMRGVYEESWTDLGSAPTDLDPCYINFGGTNPYYESGDVVDYVVYIVPLPPCTGTPSAGTAVATDTTGCTLYGSTLTDTGSTVATGIMDQWQSSTDGVTWTDIAGATGTSYFATVSTTTYYRFKVSCALSGLSSTTTPLTLSVTPAPGPITMSTGGTPGGPFALCYTTSGVSFSGAATGGTWSESTTAVGTIASGTGAWTPSGSTGGTILTYTIASCMATASLSINSVSPAAPTLASGSNPLCAYSSLLLSDATTGGVWSSASSTVATVDPTGLVTGTGSGTTMISYDDGCGATTYSLTVNGSAIVIAPSATSVCNGSAVNFTATYVTGTGTSYSWSGPAGSSASSALSVSSFTSADMGTYTFVTTTSSATGSCLETLTTTLTVLPSPSIMLAPASSGLCLGSGTATAPTVTLVPAGIPIVAQNFNSGMTGQVGGTWSVVNTGDVSDYNWAITAPYTWYDVTVGGDGTDYIGTNADLAGGSVTLNTYLNSPSFSTVGYSSASVSFNHYIYSTTGSDAYAEIDYSIDGGATWNVLQNYLGMTDGSTYWTAGVPTHTLSLPAAALGQPNVMLSWHYSSNYGWYWAVDNIEVDGAAAPLTYAWGGVSGATGISCSTCLSPTISPATTGVEVYTFSATSGTCSASTSDTLTVYSSGTISGATSICVGATSTLTSSGSGGTWSSSNTSIASVDSSTGIVSGVSTGIATISYTTGGGCFATITVNIGSGTSATIYGLSYVCAGSSITLADSVSGGAWSSTNTAIATIGATTGILSGVSSGIDTILYNTGCGSPASMIVTVNGGPASIAGTTTVCVGSTVTLTDSTAGGTWSSASSSIAVAGSSTGVIYGAGAGTTHITYTQGCGHSIIAFTVSGAPASITGTAILCATGTTTLADATTGGTWSSSDAAIATVGATSGVVTGAGTTATTATISYTTTCGYTTRVVTLNGAPASIGGTLSVCMGGTSVLADSSAAGTWSVASTLIATVNAASGVVMGIDTGTTNVTYTTACGYATAEITVNSLTPAPISGLSTVCQGSSITMSDATSGGTWSASPASLAMISPTGLLNAMAGGTVTVSYTTGCGVAATTTVIIHALPSIITGTTSICSGDSTTLYDSVAGGSWYSGAPATASVSSSGVVTGHSLGGSIITYTNSCGSSYIAVSVNTAMAGLISGVTSVCTGDSTSLFDSVAGGYWSVGVSGLAHIGHSSGVLYGDSAGTVAVSYSTGCGLPALLIVTVNASPAVISGSSTVCQGATGTLSDAVASGRWSSSSVGTVMIDSISGVVTGEATGVSTITYALATCGMTTLQITVMPLPSAISGSSIICMGGTAIFSDAIGGGVWSSGDTGVAHVSSVGIVTAASTGTTIISYTNSCGSAVLPITVSTTPSAITGASNICVGTVDTLTEAATGVTWSSSAPGVATISSAGIITGVAGGITNISCTGACGTVTKSVTVNSSIEITGATSVCFGGATTLSDAMSGGTWTSTDTSVATISAGGVVSGLTIGATTIIYNSGTTSCGSASISFMVNGVPPSITGDSIICLTGSTTLSDAQAGGTWTSGSLSVASIGASTGIVIPTAVGTASITYTTACGSTSGTFRVISSAAAITDSLSSVCVGHGIMVTDAIPGGVWSSSATGIASVNASGVVNGVSTGVATISYSIGCGLPSVATITVNPLPASISGLTAVCPGTSTTLTDAGGGFWSSSDSTHASVSGMGVVNGHVAGSVLITYSLPTGCYTVLPFTIDAIPNGGIITGLDSICVGTTIIESDTAHGGLGTWSGSDSTIATVSGGLIAGIAPGIVTISYSVTYGCGTGLAHKTIKVKPIPVVGPITGVGIICADSALTLADSVYGGTWSSMDTMIARVNAAGVVTGVTTGVDSIVYTISGYCGTVRTAAAIAVVGHPSAISGITTVCTGNSVSLTDSVPGGSWYSSDLGTATVNISSGVVRGVSSGLVTITYVGCGSNATTSFIVNATPSAGSIHIADTMICQTSCMSFADSVMGGTWLVSNGNATVDSATMMVCGVAAGRDTLIYTVTSATCGTAVALLPLVVNSLPVAGALIGTDSVCVGSTTMITPTASGGTWFITNMGATIDSTGTVHGVMAGLDTVGYFATSTYCGSDTVRLPINVMPLPEAGMVSGFGALCVGSVDTLHDSISGGMWSVQDTIVAAISASGVVSGMAVGTDSVWYHYTNSCGTATASYQVTVMSLPVHGNIISSMDSICRLAVAMFSDSTASVAGTWVSTSNSIATINSSGTVTGISAGNDTILYVVTNMCGRDTAKKAIVIIPSPDTSLLAWVSMCTGSTMVLADSVHSGSGVWLSKNSGIAAVNVDTLLAVSGGVDTVVHIVPVHCGVSLGIIIDTVYDYPTVDSITGFSFVCQGTRDHVDTLTGYPAGGYWSSSIPSDSISSTGSMFVLGGIATGRDTVMFIASNHGCISSVFTVVDVFTKEQCDSILEVGSVTLQNGSINIYPNPNSGSFTVELPGTSTDAEIMIMDVTGQVIMTRNIENSTTGKEVFNLNNVARGAYLVEVRQGSVTYHAKVVIAE